MSLGKIQFISAPVVNKKAVMAREFHSLGMETKRPLDLHLELRGCPCTMVGRIQLLKSNLLNLKVHLTCIEMR